MKPYQVEIYIYSRVLKQLEKDYNGTYTNSWHKTLEDAESQIFRTTHRLDMKVMAYKATIKENGLETAFWTNDTGQIK